MPNRKTLILTGASGFCAARVMACLQGDFDVVALPRAAMDIAQRDACLATIRQIKPFAVIHSAAIADMRACEADPDASYRVNVLGSETMAIACAETGARLIHFSTDQVYSGTPSPAPHSEEATLAPASVYGRHKQMAEARIAQTGAHYAAIRLTWMFDFPARNMRMAHDLLWLCRHAIDTGVPLTLPSRTKHGITYVYEVAKRIAPLLDAAPGIYNFGSAGELTTYEAAKLVFTLMGAQRHIDQLLIPADETVGSKPDLRMNCAKAGARLEPFVDTQEGIRKAFCEYGYV